MDHNLIQMLKDSRREMKSARTVLMSSNCCDFDSINAYIDRWTDSYNRLEEIIGLSGAMSKSHWLKLLGERWTDIDNVSAHLQDLKRLVPSKTSKEMMTNEERAQLNSLPNDVKIYRGCGEKNIDGICWSIDREVAVNFTTLNRYRVDQRLLVTATVNRSKIIAFKTGRSEQEVITFEAVIEGIEMI